MKSSGSKGALGGVATELGVVQELNRILKLPVDPIVHDKQIEVAKKLGEDFSYRMQQAFPIAISVLCWIQRNHYNEKVVKITWTGPKGTNEQLGICERHPADLVLEFESNDRIGVSVKSSTTNGSKLNFRNRGIDSLCFDMNCNTIAANCHKSERQFLFTHQFSTRKELLINQKSDNKLLLESKEEGTRILQQVRTDLVSFFTSQSLEVQKRLLLENFINFTESSLPYIKVTGLKSKAPIVEDPLNNSMADILDHCTDLSFVPSGKYVIKVKANSRNIIDLSPKYSNQKISTGVIIIAR